MPVDNFRIEIGSAFASYDIHGVAGFEDRRQLAWQGVSVDFRYRFLDRDAAPFGLTFALETHANRIDDMTGALARRYGTELTLALDRELIPNRVVAAFNLPYEPEWTHLLGAGVAEQESTAGGAVAASGIGIDTLLHRYVHCSEIRTGCRLTFGTNPDTPDWCPQR